MRALLLAAGLGTRLQPITKDIPKCLVPINGKPLVDYWLEQLFQVGVERILINTHYLAQQVEEHISKSPYSCKVDLIYEKELLMTGGTVLANRDFFLGEAFMVAHADNFSICDFAKFIDTHTCRQSNVEITMMTFETDAPQSCGIVELDDQGVVQQFHEKKKSPPSNLANAAVYIMENNVLDVIKKAERGNQILVWMLYLNILVK